MTYRYVKAPPGYRLKKNRGLKSYVRLGISALLLTVGIAAFTSVAYPLLYYQLKLAPRLESNSLESPVVTQVENALAPAVKSVQASEPQFMPEMINTTLDYTDPSVWFPEATQEQQLVEETTYKLSIPRLGIKDATVITSSSDLKKSLIHYPGTALPGDLGNTVIFGHSVLPQFYNPKNYISIFSTLHTLVEGDEIFLSYDNVEYRYKITDMYEVLPDNLSPLAQSFDARRLTLITCTPPGTYLRRLIVKADLL